MWLGKHTRPNGGIAPLLVPATAHRLTHLTRLGCTWCTFAALAAAPAATAAAALMCLLTRVYVCTAGEQEGQEHADVQAPCADLPKGVPSTGA